MLRDYQQKLYADICKSFQSGNNRVLAVAPCGAGKSYIFSQMVKDARKGYVLILTHRQELFDQHTELLNKLGATNYRVAMIMTEANRLGQYETPSLIVADEAHLSRANSWVKVIQHYNTYTVGFTATPVRLTGEPLADIYDDLIDSVSVKWLIENKMLAPYEYYAPTLVEIEGLRVQMGDYVTKDLEQLMQEHAIYGDVIDNYRKFADGEKTIVYCVSVKHAENVAEAFNQAGITAEWLCGGTPPEERKRVMADFRAGRVKVLCNVGIISEGVSIDDVTCCMLLRPTESIALGVQQMMRCMRYLPGKTAKIIDCVANYTRIGLPDDERVWSLDKRLKKKEIFTEEGDFAVRVCPECFMTFKTAPKCPYCGAEYITKPREIKEHQEIELKRIEAEDMERLAQEKKKKRMEVGQCRTLEDLWKIAKERNYANGWVYNMAKAKGIRR